MMIFIVVTVEFEQNSTIKALRLRNVFGIFGKGVTLLKHQYGMSRWFQNYYRLSGLIQDSTGLMIPAVHVEGRLAS